MTKRRRERDRPKAGPDSTYDPNKRVLLSYDSDDEGETSLIGASAAVVEEDPRAKKRTVEDQQYGQATLKGAAEEVPDQSFKATRGEGTDGQDNIGKQVAFHEEPITTTQDPSPRREDSDEYDPATAFQSSEADSSKIRKPERKGNAYPSKNAATNQKPALGSLSYQYEDDEEDGGWESAEDEAMAYLRAVRMERQNMPVVLRAAVERDEENLYEIGDSRGYIEEDCYIARPIIGPQAPSGTSISAMQAYTDTLKTRFLATRASFNGMPLLDSSASPHEKHPTPQPRGGNVAYAQCLRLVRSTSPSPAQLRSMDQESVLSLLEMIQKHYFQRGRHLSRNTSAWIWALLARLEDVGMMNNDEVSVLRELGKRAVIIQISFNDAATAAQLEGVGREEEVTQVSGEDAAASEQNASTPDSEADTPDTLATDKDNTLATLDMVLAIVGELFGQRDLLEFRRSWKPEAHIAAESEKLYGS